MLDLGFWVPCLSVVATAGVYGTLAFFFLAKPVELMEKYGYTNPASTPMWATLVSFMRMFAAMAINVGLFFLFLVYTAFVAGWFSKWSLWLVFMFNGALLAAAVYRVYVEDAKSANNSEASISASQKNVMLFGGLTCLCLLGFFFSWIWQPADGEYVTDSLHGLPDELSLIRTTTARFLKQQVLGHA